jgi:hypothetical protein
MAELSMTTDPTLLELKVCSKWNASVVGTTVGTAVGVGVGSGVGLVAGVLEGCWLGVEDRDSDGDEVGLSVPNASSDMRLFLLKPPPPPPAAAAATIVNWVSQSPLLTVASTLNELSVEDEKG